MALHYYGRPARPDEITRLENAVNNALAAGEGDQKAWASVARVLMASNEFLYID